MFRVLIYGFIMLIFLGCKNGFERKLVGEYIINKYESVDTAVKSNIPHVELQLYSDLTFHLCSNGFNDSGKWEASSLREFDNIDFLFDNHLNKRSDANFDISTFSTLIFILNPKDFHYPELRKLSLRKK